MPTLSPALRPRLANLAVKLPKQIIHGPANQAKPMDHRLPSVQGGFGYRIPFAQALHEYHAAEKELMSPHDGAETMLANLGTLTERVERAPVREGDGSWGWNSGIKDGHEVQLPF